MTNFIIRQGESDEVEHFALYDEANQGDILVAELNGKVVAFAQADGAYIYFLESNVKGAGTAILDILKEQYDWLQACNVSPEAASYWMKQGFERAAATGERPNEHHYEWYSEE
jgi:hypothetical protein